MKILHMVAFALTIIGAVNLGLTAFSYNIIEMILGAGTSLAMIVYVFVGLSAVYIAATHMSDCKICSKK